MQDQQASGIVGANDYDFFPEILERTMAWVDAQARTNGGGEDGVVGWLAS
eukprot:COSAG05_NODE_26532_length_187_cov_19.681818_1_plen_49_part_10